MAHFSVELGHNSSQEGVTLKQRVTFNPKWVTCHSYVSAHLGQKVTAYPSQKRICDFRIVLSSTFTVYQAEEV